MIYDGGASQDIMKIKKEQLSNQGGYNQELWEVSQDELKKVKKKPTKDLERSLEELKEFIKELQEESKESYVTIKIPLRDPENELQRTLKATDLCLALWDLSQIYRTNRKYKDQDPSVVSEEEFFEVLEKRGINLDRMIV